MATCQELASQIASLDYTIASLDVLVQQAEISIAIQKIPCIALDAGHPNPFTTTSTVARLEQLQAEVPPRMAVIAAYQTLVGYFFAYDGYVQQRATNIALRDILQSEYVAQGC